jgi:tetratricopeptide (TPR) repeat protein
MHWQASLDIIKKHLLVGNGLGSQRFNLPKYYRPEFAVYEAPNIYLDYAHNDILDVLLAAGLFGLVSYLFLIIATFYHGLKSIKKFLTDGFKVYGLELMALIGILGYLASITLSFHVMSTLLYFWLFIAIILSSKINNAEMVEAEKSSAVVSITKLSPLKLILISLLLISTIFSIWQFNLTLYLSNYFLLRATITKLQGNWQTMIQNNQLAVKFQPDNPFFRFQFANFLLDAATRQEESAQKLKLIDTGIQNIEAIPYKERPVEALNLNAWLLTEKTNLTRDSYDYEKAEKAFQLLADFAPGAALTYNNWCTLEGYVGQTDKAMAICQKALSLYPNIDHPDIGPEQKKKIIEEEVQVYGKLASVYFSKKDYQNALMNYQQILRLDPAQIVPWLKMAQIYYLQNNINATVSALTHGYIRDPHNPIWTNNLSVLYQKKKDSKQAKFWSERTKEIQAEAEAQTTY